MKHMKSTIGTFVLAIFSLLPIALAQQSGAPAAPPAGGRGAQSPAVVSPESSLTGGLVSASTLPKHRTFD